MRRSWQTKLLHIQRAKYFQITDEMLELGLHPDNAGGLALLGTRCSKNMAYF